MTTSPVRVKCGHSINEYTESKHTKYSFQFCMLHIEKSAEYHIRELNQNWKTVEI